MNFYAKQLPGFPFLGSTTRHFTGSTPKFGIDWQTQLWGKNLANKGYFITTAANGNAPSGLIAAPRTFGVSITRRFGG